MKLNSWAQQIEILEGMLRDRRCSQIQAVLSGTQPMQLCTCRSETNDLWSVYLSEETKIGVKTLRKMREECVKQGVTRVLLVGVDGLTPFALKELKTYDDAVVIEIFKKADLAFNVTKHHLVPRHEVLTGPEKRELLAELQCKPSALPKVRSSDPVVKYMGCLPGSILRIHRHIGSMEEEVYYRLVVP